MIGHHLFYYPYASFTADQRPLLRAAALYFDELCLLDPLKANFGGIGAGPLADEMRLLEQAGLLRRIAPEEVLHRYERAIGDAVRADLQDPEFLKLCEERGGGRHWTLALAKVPPSIRDDPQFKPMDDSMRWLMGELTGSLGGVEGDAAYNAYYDEYCETPQGVIEYRYADYPLALGEAIMVNHALFGGLLYRGAAPLTDDPFHHQVLALKIRRAQAIPEVRALLEDRARQRRLKQSLFTLNVLQDSELKLPAIAPEVPLDQVLEYRQAHSAELEAARRRLGQVARTLRETPWSDGFADEVERSIAGVDQELQGVARARDSWLKQQRGRLALTAAGLGAGAAAAVLAVFTAPITPLALVTAGLGLVSGTVIPGAEWLLDWRDGKSATQENGLHYLLKT